MSDEAAQGWLRQLQLVELEQLKEFVRVCNKFGLQYYLDGGTLLGAARHKGFIPWDNDIDVAMPRADYNRFLELAPNELHPAYLLEAWQLDPADPYYFMRIRKHNTIFLDWNLNRFNIKSHGIWIDIFPLDDQPAASSLIQHLDGFLMKWLREIVFRYHNTSETLVGKLQSAIVHLLPFNTYRIMRDRVARRHEGKNLPYLKSPAIGYGYKRETFARAWYEPHTQLEFEGDMYDVPGDFDAVLTHLYGDYMTPPPQAERIRHPPKRISFDLSGPDVDFEEEA